MSTLGDDLIQAMTEAIAHTKGEGSAVGLPEVGWPDAVKRALLP